MTMNVYLFFIIKIRVFFSFVLVFVFFNKNIDTQGNFVLFLTFLIVLNFPDSFRSMLD